MPIQPFCPIRGAKSHRCAPGEEASPTEYDPGDFILTHGSAFFSRLIQLGQMLRFRGQDRKYTRWNHAAMIVSKEGDLIEALGRGVRRSKLSKYKATEYHVIQLGPIASLQDRQQAITFAEWSLNQKYGWMTIISIALSLITGGKFNFGFEGQSICSGLVARALERTSAVFNRTPSHIMPADLAKYFEVEPPSPDSDKGKIPPFDAVGEEWEKGDSVV